jgi:hypothetical protein
VRFIVAWLRDLISWNVGTVLLVTCLCGTGGTDIAQRNAERRDGRLLRAALSTLWCCLDSSLTCYLFIYLFIYVLFS